MSYVNVGDRLITEEMVRNRVKRHVALQRVARAAGLVPGTVANFMRGRLKYAERAERALTRLLMATIERKICELEIELVALRAAHSDNCGPDIAEAEAALAKARELIERARK
jgi:hypothetical protein